MAAETAIPKSREGRVGVTFWTEKDRKAKLKHISIDTGRSAEDLLNEALDDIIEKYGKPRRR